MSKNLTTIQTDEKTIRYFSMFTGVGGFELGLSGNGACYKCNKDKKTISTFGKNICLECLEKRKTGRKGHSGMIYNNQINHLNYCNLSTELKLFKVPKSHPLFVKWYIEHYPKSKGIVGRQLNYLIYYNGKPVGIISAVSPPLNYKKFREYFNTSDEKQFVNNGVFRIVYSPKANFATQVLKLFRKTIKKDYLKKYKNELKGIITFVEKPRTGGIYKADNWDFIGETKGIEVKRRGNDWLNKTYTKTDNIKLIFGYKYKQENVESAILRTFINCILLLQGEDKHHETKLN